MSPCGKPEAVGGSPRWGLLEFESDMAHADASSRLEAETYARSIGVPESQLDGEQ